MERLLNLRRLALATIGLLAATIVLDVVVIGFDAVEFSLLYDLMNGVEVPIGAIEASDARQATASAAGLVLLALTAAAFVAWFHAAYVIVERSCAARPRYTATWAIVAWFVPILNLVRPKQIADDLWKASTPPADPPSRRSRLLTQWWALWVVATVGDVAVARLSQASTTIEGMQSAALLHAVFLAFHVAAALWAIRFVRGLTQRQTSLAAGPSAAPEVAMATPAV